MKSAVLLAAMCAGAWGLPTAEVSEARSKAVSPLSQVVSVVRAVKDCISGDVSLCLKEKALHYIESITENTELNLADGIILLEDEKAKLTRESEPLSEEPRAREEQIDSRLMDVVTDFLETRTLQLRVPSDMQRALEEGRKKKKKKKKLLKKLMPLLSLLKLKFAAMIPLFLGLLAIVAVKALFLLKISLLSSSAGLIRTLFSSLKNKGGGGGGGSSYEVASHSSSHDEYPYPASNSNSGWGRAMNDAQDLAYSGHIVS